MKVNETNVALEKELVSIVQRGCSLDYISKENRTRAVCLEAILKYPYAIEYVPTDAPFYTELAELASRLDGNVISYIDRDKYTNRIIKNAIDKDVCNITYAINNDTDRNKAYNMMYDAVTKCPWVFDYPLTIGQDNNTTDRRIIENAIRQDGELLGRVHPDMRDEELCKIALSRVNWYNIIPFIPKEFRAEIVEKLINNIRSVLEDGESKEDIWYNHFGDLRRSCDNYDIGYDD